MEILRSVRGFISSCLQHEKCSLILPLSIGIKFVNFGWAHTKLHSCQVGCMTMFELEVNHAINQVSHMFSPSDQSCYISTCTTLSDLSSNGPNKHFPCMHLILMHLEKRKECFKCATWCFCLPSRGNLHCCFPPLFSWPKRNRHVLKTPWNASLHTTFHFCINFQSRPSTVYFTLASITPHYRHPI